jgi:hypothetical protein
VKRSAPPKKRPAPKNDPKPKPARPATVQDAGTGERLAASPSVVLGGGGGSTSVSWLLLVIGLGLVVLVVGETTFLGLAESQVDFSEPRPPESAPEPEEPLPIHHVQLKR